MKNLTSLVAVAALGYVVWTMFEESFTDGETTPTSSPSVNTRDTSKRVTSIQSTNNPSIVVTPQTPITTKADNAVPLSITDKIANKVRAAGLDYDTNLNPDQWGYYYQLALGVPAPDPETIFGSRDQFKEISLLAYLNALAANSGALGNYTPQAKQPQGMEIFVTRVV